MRRYALLVTLAALTPAAIAACNGDYQDADPVDAGVDADATTPPVPIPDANTPIIEGGEPRAEAGTDAREDATLDDASTDADAGSIDAAADADASTDADASPPCPNGYEPGAGDGGCVVASPFLDPSFVGTPANAWTIGGGAVLMPVATGSFGPGVARICDDTTQPPTYRGSVQQTVSIPSSPAVDPLAIHVDMSFVSGVADYGALGVYVDGVALFDSYLGSTPRRLTKDVYSFDHCLGERAYGKARSFLIGGTGYVDLVEIEHVNLVAMASCPRPGIVPNGSFETAGGFVYTVSGTPFSLTGGTNNSRSARLATADRSSPDGIYQQVSIPNRPATALTFRNYGKGNARVTLDGRPIARVRVDATHDAQTVCLPRWAQGVVLELLISAGQNDPIDPAEATDVFFVDDVAFTDVPECEDGSRADNGGFESLGAPASDDIPGWVTTAATGYPISRAVLQPHAGTAYLAMKSTTNACTPAAAFRGRATHPFTLPVVSVAAGGPALRFWYRLNAGATGSVAKVHADNISDVTLTPTSAWTAGIVCLDGNLPGTRVGIGFDLETPSTSGCTDGELDIDDVTIGNDVACPP